MADGQLSRQRRHQVGLREIVTDIAEPVGAVEAEVGMVGDDAARFLSAVLQRVQPQGHEVRGIDHADRAKDAALLVQTVRIERMGQERLHRAGLDLWGLMSSCCRGTCSADGRQSHAPAVPQGRFFVICLSWRISSRQALRS